MEGKTLTQGAPWRSILSFMFPVFMGLLLQQLYNTVDTYFKIYAVGLVFQFGYNIVAAIATDIAQAASCVAAVWYMMKKYPVLL